MVSGVTGTSTLVLLQPHDARFPGHMIHMTRTMIQLNGATLAGNVVSCTGCTDRAIPGTRLRV